MKKILLLLIVSIFTISIMSANSFSDPVVAQVKLTKMYLVKLSSTEEKLKLAEEQVKRQLTSEEKNHVLDTIINTEIMKQAAERDGIVVTEQVIMSMLKQQVGASASDQQIRDAVVDQYKRPWNEVLEALIEQLTLQEYIKVAGAEEIKKYSEGVTEEEIQDFYNSNKTKFVNPDMVRVNHVFFSTNKKSDSEIAQIKKKAEDALLQIKKGTKSFDELVQSLSDDKNSISNGGELGFISRDDPNTVKLLGTTFINTLFGLEMDSIHGVLRSNSGFHIVTITEKRSARILKINDPINPSSPMTVRQYITQNLQQQKATIAFAQVTQSVIDKVRKEAVIKIIDKSLPWK